MATGRQRDRQGEMLLSWDELPKFAGARVLRPAARGAGRGRFRRLRRKSLQAIGHGRAVAAAGALLPHASGRLRRRDRQRARAAVALHRPPFAPGLPRPRAAPAVARPLVAEQDPRPTAARGPRGGLRLGARAPGRARPGQGRADRGRCLGRGSVAAAIQPADRGDTTSIAGTLAAAARGLDAAGCAPSAEAPTELVADKGYHSRAVLKGLDDSPWTIRIAEPRPKDVQRWHGDLDARRAVYNNRARLCSGIGNPQRGVSPLWTATARVRRLPPALPASGGQHGRRAGSRPDRL